MNSLQKHFKRELDIMRASIKDGDELLIEPYVEDINNLLKTFGNEDHNGASAPFTASVLTRTLKAILGYQVLSPLTGIDEEWEDISKIHGSPLWQNKRDASVFKQADGRCTYNHAIVWQGQEEYDTFTGGVNGYKSSNYIKEFPFMPKTFYIDVVRELYDPNNSEHNQLEQVETGHGLMVYKIKDEKQLEEVFNYYNPKVYEQSV